MPHLPALAAPAPRFGRIVRLLAILLLSTLLLVPAGSAQALRTPQPPPLQEVAPPAGALAVRTALADRQPRISIVAPADDSLLTGEDWTLTLRLQDWPVHEPTDLGPGPHLVVQLDGEPARRLFTPPADGELWTIAMPALSPGSHRLTAYAAWPWGEPVVAPGALDQHRLHRTARSPQGLPSPQGVQLLPAGPATLAAGAPVPISWLLVDAPLQNLRPDDARWRLQIGVDGTTLLLDRDEPFWLAPLAPGLHGLTLDLLDAQGAPLGAPFTSHVLELTVPPRGKGIPAVLRPQLSPEELDRLLAGTPPQETITAEEAPTEPEAAPGGEEALPEAPQEPGTAPGKRVDEGDGEDGERSEDVNQAKAQDSDPAPQDAADGPGPGTGRTGTGGPNPELEVS
ncbi:MAG: hypothetical protein VKM68_00935 [Cyanobacteriota bacterium]|nr:hypothetical protein [Cyanobacteriota bacterium]